MTAQPDLFDPPKLKQPTRTAENSELARQAQSAAAQRGGKYAVVFRDPATGAAWNGRGLKPGWLLMALENGKTLADFRV